MKKYKKEECRLKAVSSTICKGCELEGWSGCWVGDKEEEIIQLKGDREIADGVIAKFKDNLPSEEEIREIVDSVSLVEPIPHFRNEVAKAIYRRIRRKNEPMLCK